MASLHDLCTRFVYLLLVRTLSHTHAPTHICTNPHSHTHTHTYTRTHAHTHTHICTRIHTHTHKHTHGCSAALYSTFMMYTTCCHDAKKNVQNPQGFLCAKTKITFVTRTIFYYILYCPSGRADF